MLRELGISLSTASQLFCDNLSALHLNVNPKFHARTEHIELDYSFICEKVALGLLTTRFVSSTQQHADIFTKALARDTYDLLRFKLGVQGIDPPSLRGRINGAYDQDQSQSDFASSTSVSLS